MSSAKTTIDHEAIQQWVEERGGNPARVKGTGDDDDPGVLRIDYPGFSGVQTLEAIEWETFFEAFEDNELAFLYQDEPNSRFSKLIARANMDEDRSNGRERESGTDAISLLESQHREVESLFEQLHEAESTRKRSELFSEIADKLAAHTKIEETIFYPAVCADETVEQLRESVEEHLAVKRAIAELLDMKADAKQFMAKVEVLEELVNHHVEEEESQLFVQVREQELVDVEILGRKMKKRFEELLESEPRTQVGKETGTAASLPC